MNTIIEKIKRQGLVEGIHGYKYITISEYKLEYLLNEYKKEILNDKENI